VSRWLSETGGTSGKAYAARFAALAALGTEMHGEASYVDSLLTGPSDVLDAGCGTGRVAVELARRGHRVVGADNDASMLEVARRSPEVRWELADLAVMDLTDRFDLVVAAGNVMVFLEPGSEARVVARLAAHLRPGGLLVCGWRTDRLALSTYERWVAQAGLEPLARHATWDAAPWRDDADWCVAVDLAPAGA
jgi:SAM-dependent methyltransferase